jgi:outer membrane protein assembly complex protein YaeT
MKIRSLRPILILLWFLTPFTVAAQEDWGGRTVSGVEIEIRQATDISLAQKLRPLLEVREGEVYQYQALRRSMENLYLSGILHNVNVEAFARGKKGLVLRFVCEAKLSIRKVLIHKRDVLSNSEVRAALLSLKSDRYLDQQTMSETRRQIERLYQGEGYLSPQVDFKIKTILNKSLCDVHVHIQAGLRTRVGRLTLTCQRPELQDDLRRLVQMGPYQPRLLEEQLDRMRQFLRKKFFFFPEITVNTEFNGLDKKTVNLGLSVDPGPLYRFEFHGLPNRFRLIQSVWTTKVFERWAETESRQRLLLYLKNKGYHDARVESAVDESKAGEKRITFTAERGKRYRLGKIRISGAPDISDRDVKAILSVDDNWFYRIFWLMATPLLVDQEMIRLYYYQQGYPEAKVAVETSFEGVLADLHFKVVPGRQVTLKSITWQGNQQISGEALQKQMKSLEGAPFVSHIFSEDMDRLRRLYTGLGHAQVTIVPRISSGYDKEIEVVITEGPAYRVGELIVIGGSPVQEKWVRRMFPLKTGEPYDITKVARFLEEIEQVGTFSKIQLNTVEIEKGRYNVLVSIDPFKSISYGFGFGIENRKGWNGLRGTLEFLGRNVLGSYSSFSGILQAGLGETRFVLSLDTPRFLGTNLSSSMKFWREQERFTSYRYTRVGLGPTLLKQTAASSFFSANLNWYNTEINDLFITPTAIDNLSGSFNTLALNLSFVSDRRDDPFNPSQGDFFSVDLKLAMPFIRDFDSFFRFLWRYQKNVKFLKTLSLAFSARHGFAAGDLSVTERFFAGGINSFRGTRLDRLGPGDAATGNPLGGKGLLLFNVEATFPLIFLPMKDWYGSVFADVGNVYNRASEISLTDLEQAVGFGIKYRTPLGPLRVDLSWNLRDNMKPQFIFQFGIGNAF